MLLQEYDFYLADSDAARSIHYNLRYQVYCLREKFENPASHPNFLEQDKYDELAAHFIVRSRLTREWLGAMRLIVAPVQKLPVSKISSLDPTSFTGVTRKRAAEASRLCTLMPTTPRSNFAPSPPKLRKPQVSPQGLVSHALQTSWMAIGLIRAARQYCLKHDILYCFFFINDPLARMLRRLGMEIEPVGSPCLHRGWRRPYIHNVKTGYQAMSTRSPELYKVFSRLTAYSRFSKWENTAEALPLAASGGDHQPVIRSSNLTQTHQKPADQSRTGHERPLLRAPAAPSF